MKNFQSFYEFLNESKTNESKLDTKYWVKFNNVKPGINKNYSDKSDNFDVTFGDAIEDWNQEADPRDQMEGIRIEKIKKIAKEFFEIEKWISINVVLAMIMQKT